MNDLVLWLAVACVVIAFGFLTLVSAYGISRRRGGYDH